MISKRVIYYICYKFARLLSIFKYYPGINNNKKVVIFKPDAIGDYILFRNFIFLLEKDGVELLLIGNHAWATLAEHYDLNCSFIPFMRRRFIRNPFYRTYFLQKMARLKNVDTILYPCFSREGVAIEELIRILPAKNKIAWFGDTINQSEKSREITKRWYTQMYQTNNKYLFEFERNRQYFSNFLKKKLALSSPKLDVPERYFLDLPEHYALLFIGASAKFRQWPIEHYAEVAQYIKTNFNMDIAIGGGPNDLTLGNKLVALLDGRCINLVGKTSQLELIELIYRSKLLVSNETGIPHIAVALKHRNIFVVSNGNHYGRFTPYPKNICERYFSVYPSQVERLSEEQRCHQFSRGSSIDINTITPQKVIDIIQSNIDLYL